MKKVLFLMAMVSAMLGCNGSNTVSEEKPGLLAPSETNNNASACGTASQRTLALDETRKLLPENSTIRFEANCPLVNKSAHLTTFTRIDYGKGAACPGDHCKYSLACAIVDTFGAVAAITTSAAIFYAEWTTSAEVPPALVSDCGTFPAGVTSSSPSCIPTGFLNPVTGTAEFKAFVTEALGKKKNGLDPQFKPCILPYQSKFTE